MDTNSAEQYWNDKHPKNPVIYTGRAIPQKCPTCKGETLKERLKIDVKTMLNPDDFLCKSILTQNNLIHQTSDDTMASIQKWVVSNLKYIGDDLSQGTMEYWQFPFETLSCNVGDCEDGALLIASLAVNSGVVPAFRIRVVAGMVQPEPTAPQGGHAYVSYLRESDNQWVVIDWCYYEDSAIPMSQKQILKHNLVYKDVWFSFNHVYSWSNTLLQFESF